MGFRSTLISEHYAIDWPQWFRDKHSGWINDNGILISPCEVKFMTELIEDTYKVLTDLNWFKGEHNESDMEFNLVSLHECGGLTKIQLDKDGIHYGDPADWEITEYSDGNHVYCYGCSDLRKYEAKGSVKP